MKQNNKTFLVDFNNKFSVKNFLTEKRTVCVLYKDGRLAKHPNITDPWKYIVAVKKQITVENAWIDEK